MLRIKSVSQDQIAMNLIVNSLILRLNFTQFTSGYDGLRRFAAQQNNDRADGKNTVGKFLAIYLAPAVSNKSRKCFKTYRFYRENRW